MKKICKKCNILKPVSEFNKKKNGFQPLCRACSKVAFKDHYQKNKEYHYKKSLLQKKKMRDYVNGLKAVSKCAICGESHFACLHFHHKEGTVKLFNLSNHNRGSSLKKLQEEINKCEILCANCHAKLHYEKRNSPMV